MFNSGRPFRGVESYNISQPSDLMDSENLRFHLNRVMYPLDQRHNPHQFPWQANANVIDSALRIGSHHMRISKRDNRPVLIRDSSEMIRERINYERSERDREGKGDADILELDRCSMDRLWKIYEEEIGREREIRENVERIQRENIERDRRERIESRIKHERLFEECRVLEGKLGFPITPASEINSLRFRIMADVEAYFHDLKIRYKYKIDRDLFEEARALEKELGFSGRTPEWGQHNVEWWSNPENPKNYVDDLKRQASEKRESERMDEEFKVEREQADAQGRVVSLFEQQEREHARMRREVEEQSEQTVKRQELNSQFSELSNSQSLIENESERIFEKWIAIQSSYMEKAALPNANQAIVRHYDRLRTINFNHIGAERMDFENARILEGKLGSSSTPNWSARNIGWWGNSQNVSGYLGDLGRQVRERGLFDEARNLEDRLGQQNTPPWGQHNVEWWSNFQNVEDYLRDLRNRATMRGV